MSGIVQSAAFCGAFVPRMAMNPSPYAAEYRMLSIILYSIGVAIAAATMTRTPLLLVRACVIIATYVPVTLGLTLANWVQDTPQVLLIAKILDDRKALSTDIRNVRALAWLGAMERWWARTWGGELSPAAEVFVESTEGFSQFS